MQFAFGVCLRRRPRGSPTFSVAGEKLCETAGFLVVLPLERAEATARARRSSDSSYSEIVTL